MSEILALDTHINRLIKDISEAQNLSTNELLKSKVSFQLTKINFGLKLIERTMKLFGLQEQIEDRLLTEDSIKDLSIRELLVMSSVNSKRIDNYFSKMDKILGSLNLRDLENSLLMITELDNKRLHQEAGPQSDESKKLTTLSLQLLKTLTSIQGKDAVIEGETIDQETADSLSQQLNKVDLSTIGEELVSYAENNEEAEAKKVLKNLESIASPRITLDDNEDEDDDADIKIELN